MSIVLAFEDDDEFVAADAVDRAVLIDAADGLAQALQIFFQIHEVPISMYVTLMMPYLFTLVALAIISTSKKPSMPEQLKIIT